MSAKPKPRIVKVAMAQILVRPGRPRENLSRATKAIASPAPAAGVAWAEHLKRRGYEGI